MDPAVNAATPWPTISVVIPSYNCARYLARALDSALGQHYPADRLEIVVVDDGSVDMSAELARTYAARHPNVRVFEQPNAGPAAARNRGIENSHGELIAFLEARGASDERQAVAERIAAEMRRMLAHPSRALAIHLLDRRAGLHQELQIPLLGVALAERVHRLELLAGVDMHDRERHVAEERLAGEPQHDVAVLAEGLHLPIALPISS